jgi:hypothetical protein
LVLSAEALKKVKLLGSYASYRNHLDPLNRPGGERLSLPEAEHFIGTEVRRSSLDLSHRQE